VIVVVMGLVVVVVVVVVRVAVVVVATNSSAFLVRSHRACYNQAFTTDIRNSRDGAGAASTHGGDKREVHYCKGVDSGGNAAFANPGFPMSMDLQACELYREVYGCVPTPAQHTRTHIH
jgi:hypothetical protein